MTFPTRTKVYRVSDFPSFIGLVAVDRTDGAEARF